MVNDTFVNFEARTYGYHRYGMISIHAVHKYSQPVAKKHHYLLLACQHRTETSPYEKG